MKRLSAARWRCPKPISALAPAKASFDLRLLFLRLTRTLCGLVVVLAGVILKPARIQPSRYQERSFEVPSTLKVMQGSSSSDPPHCCRRSCLESELRSLLDGVLIEEANHLASSLWALWIHIRAARVSPEPRVTAFMHQPMFENNASS